MYLETLSTPSTSLFTRRRVDRHFPEKTDWQDQVMAQRAADVLNRWDPRRLEIPIPRPTLNTVTAPIDGAKRRFGRLSAWLAILAVAGISLAARRRAQASATEAERTPDEA